MLLADRVAIITGGAIGMGKSMALKFADEGCSVVVADILEAEGARTAEEVSQKGRGGIFVKCDVTDIRQIEAMVAQTISRLGKVDILVNNAGGVTTGEGELPKGARGGRGGIANITEERWNRALALNLKGPVFCCKAVVPHMRAKKYGKIISISSLGAYSPPSPAVDYHCAKAGVIGMTYNLAFELAPDNINVNAILPGPVRTAFWDPVISRVPDTDKEDFFAGLAKQVPLQRYGTPEDIAGAALFLASELSSYMTGEVLAVSGGIPLSVYREF
jgi:NAD(P)-dependent dehydrogenase (short-subunit alcohol dehydrogenase family)